MEIAVGLILTTTRAKDNNTVEFPKAMEFAETVQSVWTDDSCVESNAMREFFIFQIASGLSRIPWLKFGC